MPDEDKSRIVYSRAYNMGFPLLSRLHPFDASRAVNAYKELERTLGSGLAGRVVAPTQPISEQDLLLVHTEEYLEKLRSSAYVGRAIEIGLIRYLPRFLVDWILLKPMRYATQGTILAAREALKCGLTFNLGGGFHHAKPTRGEGFCVYADAGIAVAALRRDGLLGPDDGVVYVDLDAHLGNGVAHVFMNDPRVSLFDMFNSWIYPDTDVQARERVDCAIPLRPSTDGDRYLSLLKGALPKFLDDAAATRKISLAIYNAGTDIFEKDGLGQLSVSADAILERDLYTVGELRKRGIPTVMLPSGGYTRESASLISRSVATLMGASAPPLAG